MAKYVSPEQQACLAAEAAANESARLRADGDEAKNRALRDMMYANPAPSKAKIGAKEGKGALVRALLLRVIPTQRACRLPGVRLGPYLFQGGAGTSSGYPAGRCGTGLPVPACNPPAVPLLLQVHEPWMSLPPAQMSKDQRQRLADFERKVAEAAEEAEKQRRSGSWALHAGLGHQGTAAAAWLAQRVGLCLTSKDKRGVGACHDACRPAARSGVRLGWIARHAKCQM